MKLGKNLKRIRKAHKISREQLADALNLSYSSICKYECGVRTPDFESLVKIAQFFHISLDELADMRPHDDTIIDDDSDVIALPCILQEDESCYNIPQEDELALSADELHLLSLFRKLGSEDKITVTKTLESLIRANANTTSD